MNMSDRPQIKFALLPLMISAKKHIAKCAVTHIPPIITNAMNWFEQSFTTVVSSTGMQDVTYTLFGGALRDFIIAAMSPNSENDAININDFDIRIIFPDETSQGSVKEFMSQLCSQLIKCEHSGSITQEKQIGDERLRSIVKIDGFVDYDISFRPRSDLGCTDEDALDMFTSSNHHSYSLSRLSTAKFCESKPKSVSLTSSDFVAIDRVESSSAGISAVAMSREGGIWVSSRFIGNINRQCITQARDGDRHAQYCRFLHKRKFPNFDTLIEGDEHAIRVDYGDGTSALVEIMNADADDVEWD
jgi:hypothetical protein